MKLSDVKPGKSCVIESVCEHNAFCRRLCDMGFLPGTKVTVVATAPFGDPMELYLRGYRVTLRRGEASFINVTLYGRDRLWKG